MYTQPGVTASLIACFYEGITAPRRHSEGLQLMAEQLDCDHASLTIWDSAGNWARTHRALRRNNCWQLGVEENSQPAVELRALVDQMEPGQWQVHENFLASAADAGADEINRCSTAAHLNSSLCIRLLSTQGAEFFLTLRQSSFSWKASTKAMQLAENMARPLCLAMDMLIHMRKLSQQADNMSAVLDCIRMPLLMLDGALRILVVNTLAKPLIQVYSSHGQSNGRSNVSSTYHQSNQISLAGIPVERFATLVRRACGQLGPVSAGNLQLRAPDGQPDIQLVVLPMTVSAAGGKSASALVLICGQQIYQESADQLLQHIYALTPAEARLAMLILRGQAPSEAAAHLQVSVATVRTQLSAVLKKTGAQRQSDLVQRLSSILLINQRVARSST